jgi:hypothetical protein
MTAGRKQTWKTCMHLKFLKNFNKELQLVNVIAGSLFKKQLKKFRIFDFNFVATATTKSESTVGWFLID